MKHLLREYEDQKGVGECGKKGLKDREVTTKACEVTCPRCHKTKAFAKAAKHPYYGLKGKKPKQARKRKSEWDEAADKAKEGLAEARRTGKPVMGASQKKPARRGKMDLWDDVLLGECK